MTGMDLAFGDQTVVLLPEGAIFWPSEKMLIVADLHLEKSSSRRAVGVLLPPYDTRLTLERLSALVRTLAPQTVIALGDSFHDRHAADRLDADSLRLLADLTAVSHFIWLTGNHDPLPPQNVQGRVYESFSRADFRFRHIPSTSSELRAGTVEFAGHLHPKLRLNISGHAVARRCFVVGNGRVLLPAFGAYTGGLDVTAPAIRTLFTSPPRIFVAGARRVYRVATPG